MASIRPKFLQGRMPSASGLDGLSRAVFDVRSGRGINARVDGGILQIETTGETNILPCTVLPATGATVRVRKASFFTRDGMVESPFNTPEDWILEISASQAVTVIFCRYKLQDDEWEEQTYSGGDYPFITESGADLNNFQNVTMIADGFYIIPIAAVYWDSASSKITSIVQYYTGNPSYIAERTGTVNMTLTDPATVGDLDNWPGWSVYSSLEGLIPVGYDTVAEGVFGYALSVGDTFGEVTHGFNGTAESHQVSLNNNTVLVDYNQDGATTAVLTGTTVPTNTQDATHIPPVRIVCFIVKN